ncbi:MAG: hypothetical protein HY521_00400 [Proteobacteria bacterium]|nr:hypothetical protein [Pseudomonadota bacterium]
MVKRGVSAALVGVGGAGRMLAEALAGKGLRVAQLDAAGLKGALPGLDLVFLSLAGEAEAAALFGALAGAEPKAGAAFVDVSDGGASALAGAERAGVAARFALLDGALVQHYPEDGRRVMTLLLGGPAPAAAALAEALAGAFREVIAVGGFGAAHTAGALIAAMFLAMKNAAEEVAEVARRHGIAPADMLAIVNKSSGESLAAKVLARELEEPAGGNADLFRAIEAGMEEEARTVARLAEGLGVLPLFTRHTLERIAIKRRSGAGRGGKP